MPKEKKNNHPDAVVFNEVEERYDAFLKPYATTVGAPVITPKNMSPWKNRGVKMVNEALQAEFDELKSKYNQLQDRFEMNNLVYAAHCNFQPIVGKVYHLYKDQKEALFLSILAPEECNFNHIGSFRLGSDYIWEKVS
ncbi:MAG: DUF2452 domain-containing protein [Croceitalea sp.]|nr:DUF2452 domain-containing protein [Croceitalea sp.]